MKQIDVRFSASDMAAIKSMIGKRMLKYKCDPFEFSTSVYGIVGIALEDSSYAFTNLTEVMDYFGDQEDVALFKLKQMSYADIHSMIQGQTMIDNPIDSIIKEINIVNEKQQLFDNEVLIYEVLVTRGIIFKFDAGHELSLEKNIWFSEDISIEKGYNLINRFSPVNEFEESWSGNLNGICQRNIISLKP